MKTTLTIPFSIHYGNNSEPIFELTKTYDYLFPKSSTVSFDFFEYRMGIFSSYLDPEEKCLEIRTNEILILEFKSQESEKEKYDRILKYIVDTLDRFISKGFLIYGKEWIKDYNEKMYNVLSKKFMF